MLNWRASWIKPRTEMGDVIPAFRKRFSVSQQIEKAVLTVTALGVYESMLNGVRISDYVLAPGCTSYMTRLQYQQYDVTEFIQEENDITITVGKGWYRGRMLGSHVPSLKEKPCGLLAQLELTYTDGHTETIGTDDSWKVAESQIRFSEIYDGEIYDASLKLQYNETAEIFEGPWKTLIPQEGEKIVEQETFVPREIFTTPKGELVLDFGQEVTGYVEVTVDAKEGEKVELSHGEVLDKEGNFYNANYRSVKDYYIYTCKEGKQVYHPKLTFYGFRYVRVNAFPGGLHKVAKDNFKAIAVYSQIKRTGEVSSSNPLLNQLFSNVMWGQRDNFLDIPTDCPQRDERHGWTGDAQVFVRAAALNFDVERFFAKWFRDMRADQMKNGGIPQITPDWWQAKEVSSGWADACTVCPWEIYMAYGNPEILRDQFDCMKKYLNYIKTHTREKNLWIGGFHFGDWLGLDAPTGSYTGSSRKGLIASAFYAYSVSLVAKAGKVLGEDVSSYEKLYERIVKAFQKRYPTYKTQTEYALAINFGLAEDCQAAADQLAKKVKRCGLKLQTGFLGTPHIMHALSNYGHADVAYSLLLRTEFPSWLYPVTKGATTMWEHWDGIMENGDFWSTNMNSFNHYAYGAVIDWVYGVAAGIKPIEAGYKKMQIAPCPDDRLDWLDTKLETRSGQICSRWEKENSTWKYTITTPVETEIIIEGKSHTVGAGTYTF